MTIPGIIVNAFSGDENARLEVTIDGKGILKGGE